MAGLQVHLFVIDKSVVVLLLSGGVEGKGTGIVFPCGDVTALAQALATLIASLDLRKRLGAAASRLIDDWDVSVCAKDIGAAVHEVAARR